MTQVMEIFTAVALISGCCLPFCSPNLDHKDSSCLYRCVGLILRGQNICKGGSMCSPNGYQFAFPVADQHLQV